MPQRKNLKKVKWLPLPRTEKAEALSNPYCGLYSIFRFYADSERMYPEELLLEEVTVSPSRQLCLIEINLVHFNDRPLSDEALSMVYRIFKHFSSQGKQLIVRFMYDWEGKGIVNEPKDIEIILNHMEQLTPILREYTESIYILQGLFIGSWGEMHNSRYLSERHMTQLAKKLYHSTGELTQIALRCPSFWRMIFRTFQPLNADTAFSTSQKSRFSLFNDGIMASDSDFGTYGKIPAKDSKQHSDKWIRRDELYFQNQLCRYVSNGGEVINDCELNDAGNAIHTLKTMRISYLNSDYDEKVIEKWKNSRSGETGILWRDKTAFEYVAAHLGYRFTIDSVDVTWEAGQNDKLKASITIVNKGFAPCYHKFEVKLVIKTASYSEIHEYPVDTDTRLWMPDEKIEIEAVIDSSDYAQQNYILYLGIYDPRTKQPIQLANTFSAADHFGLYKLGSIVL